MQIRKTKQQPSASTIAEANNSSTQALLRKDDAKKHGSLYKFAVDTFAMNSFFFGVGMFNEVIVSGMTVEQSLKARAMGAVINTSAGRIYGKYRDWALKKLKVTENSSFLKKTASEICVFAVYAVPLNLAMYKIAGASNKSMIIAAAATTAACSFVARPYGVYQDWVRKKMGVANQ